MSRTFLTPLSYVLHSSLKTEYHIQLSAQHKSKTARAITLISLFGEEFHERKNKL